MLFFKIKTMFLLSLIFVTIHECIHYLVGRLLSFKNLNMQVMPFGAVLNIRDLDTATAMEEYLITVAGPMSNIILCAIFIVLYKINKLPLFYDMALCNWTLGFINIIPAFPLDGGRILRILLNKRYVYKHACEIALNVSIMVGMLLSFMYFYAYYRGKVSLSLSVGSIAIFIIYGAIKEKERIQYIIMSDLMKKRTGFIKKGYMETRVIAIHYKKSLLSTLNLIDKSKYNVFYVLNDELCVLDIVFEGDVLETLKEKGDLTFEEYINL